VSTLSRGFSVGRRRSPVAWLRVLLRLLILALLLAALWGALVGALWLYGSSQLRGVPVAALRDDVLLLGASGASAPADATTLLVLLVEPLDATVRRPSPLTMPPVILQFGGPRERPAALVLPVSVEVVVDGRGVMRLDEIQRELGADRLTQAIIDYSEIRFDHVVVLSTDVLPGLVRILGPLEVCGASGCSEPTADDVRRWQAADDPAEVVQRSADVLRAVSGVLDRRLLITSPRLGKRVVDLIAGQVVTDADLSIGRLLEIAVPLIEPRRIEVDSLPMVRNPSTGEMVVLEESAMVRFQLLREGRPFDGLDPGRDIGRLQSVTDVAVLNGAGIVGLAAFVEAELTAAGYSVIGTGNDVRFDRSQTVINYREGDREAELVAFLLAEQLPGAIVEALDRLPTFEGSPVPIVVILGSDRAGGGGSDGGG
jgi:hypothetical protein